ncbi:MAG: two-component system sensor histidine kinase FlrB [Alphaproteobacteria bacterium]|jgi:two-component system sensor histidine kinase FlrB
MLVSLKENDSACYSNEHVQEQSKEQFKSFANEPAPAQLAFLRSETSASHENSEHSVDNNQRFSHLLSIMPAGVLVVDKKGLVSLANQQAISLLGEPLIGEAWRDVIGRVFAPKDDDGHEVSMSNGKKVKIDISPLTEEKGQLIVITDLTETRELQSRVGHMQRLSSLGKMVASLAHQVRTPLSSALLYAENLKSMSLQNDMASRFSEKLSLRLRELESQVNDMLLFAKSSDNQIVSSLPTLDILKQSIAQTEAQLTQANIGFKVENNYTNEAADSRAQTDCDTADNNNDNYILGNLTAVTGAITNLISNAMQALEQQRNVNASRNVIGRSAELPQIIVSVSDEYVNEQDYCVFTVTDNGKGLAQKDINRLFEPFYTTKSQGTGLGLAVVSTVAKSHKGFVKCGNTQTNGAFFSLYIPKHNSQTNALHNSSNANNSLANKNIPNGSAS